MGLNASSDEWCSRSDVVIEGHPWARKIVDDILVWAETEEELMGRTRVTPVSYTHLTLPTTPYV